MKLIAYIKCWWWCLLHTFKGHRMLKGKNANGVAVIAAVSGNLYDKSIKFEKIFYNNGQCATFHHK